MDEDDPDKTISLAWRIDNFTTEEDDPDKIIPLPGRIDNP